jgi:hypothetical protein
MVATLPVELIARIIKDLGDEDLVRFSHVFALVIYICTIDF